MARLAWTVVVLLLGPLLGCAPPADDGTTVRVMPLGDSITQAERGHDSYRRELWRHLVASSYRVDFVGSLTDNHGGPPAHPDFDLDHEGHWGWRADQVLGRIDGWAARSRPDVVLLHLGTNDLIAGEEPAAVVAEIAAIVVRLRHHAPRAQVLVARILPLADAPLTRRIERFNQLLGRLPGELAAAGTPPVEIVDQYTGFDPVADTYDGIHPDEAGEAKMAARWFEALEEVLAPDWR